MDLLIGQDITSALLNHLASSHISSPNLLGVSTGGYGGVVHIDENTPTPEKNALANAVLNIDTLVVSRDVVSVVADGENTAIITHNTLELSVDYVVNLNGDEYAVGNEPAVAGVVTLELTPSIPGTYVVHIIDTDGMATGCVAVEGTI